MEQFLSDNWQYIALAVVALAVLWFVLTRARRSGRATVTPMTAAPLVSQSGEPLVRVRVETATPTLKVARPAQEANKDALQAPADLADKATGISAEVVSPISPSPFEPPVSDLQEGTAPTESAQVADNLRLLKGVGPKVSDILNSLGITRFEQIANWSEADIAHIDPQLGNFKGRIERDNWVDQAGFLARKDKAGFEAKYGALEGNL